MRIAFLVSFLVSFVPDNLEATFDQSLAVVILSQPTAWHEENTRQLRKSLLEDIPEARIFDTVNDFGDIHGAWAVWPFLSRLYDQLGGEKSSVQWVLICEDGTSVKGKKLLDLLQKYDAKKPIFAGHVLRDSTATIIHHFAFIGDNVSKFAYPDFSGGIVLSWPLMERMVAKLKEGRKPRDFTIDPKHELAMLIWEDGAGTEMTDVPEFCTTSTGESCITEYANGDYQRCPPQVLETTNDDVVFGVKTYHGFHKTRVVIVKRTWALEARNIEFFSDREDHYIPTIPLGVENTKKGHCGKTFAILNHFVANHAETKKWLVIADDDSLLNIRRMIKLLGCYDHTQALIIGEKYGYGFDAEGRYGYAFPTGGSGMAFTVTAATKLTEKCKCPTEDSPDDMILGVCANNFDIPIIHSPALHQARPYDYSSDYLKKTKPISFHNHWECDPYLVYSQFLAEEKQMDDQIVKSHSHSHDSEL